MKHLFTHILLSLVIISKSQNLVPNPSFETYTICPNSGTGGQIESAVPWNAATINSSTDYFNACSSLYNVPNFPAGGFQYAHIGNAFSGFYFFGAVTGNPNKREYLQVQLINPLVQNISYYVEFYVNLHDGSFSSACNNIAANFSVTRPFTTNWGDLQMLTPHIVNPGNPIINDRINWVQVSGCYTAQGGEEYLTIGNFMDVMNTQTTGTTSSSYYLVDDVRVEAVTGVCVTGVEEITNNHNIKVYPNPNNGIVTIAYSFQETIHVFELFDLMGKKVNEKNLNGNDGEETINLNRLDGGVYFYKITDVKGKLLFSNKLIIGK